MRRLEERPLLEAARRGHEEAFRELVDPLRGQLYAHCYRMLGSAHDAEDAMQDAMLRAWRALPAFEGRAPIRSWLYKIATNACLTALEQRPKRVLPIDYEPGADPHDQPPIELQGESNPEAEYEKQEAATLALTVTLHHLPANQRAALILRDVLGFPAREAASTLGTSVASVNSALQRARAKVVDCIEQDGRPESPRSVGNRQLHDAVEGFVGALARGDVDTLIGIAADTTLSAERSWTYSPLPAY
jgi:RNA polymerase sigma-70 factor, ECF subfamily